jgi:hypothetical protein
MKTILPLRKIFNCLSVVIFFLAGISLKAQTYTSIANGAWSSASTWQGGVIPPTGTISLTATINIKHIVTYSGGNIFNNGTININNQSGLSPRLIVPSGVNVVNNLTGKIYIINAEYRQYRFVGGLETGTNQTGTFKNNGGYVKVSNSFVEVAQDWSNELAGMVVFTNSSLEIGGNYDLKSLAIDSIQNTSVSIGMQGSGDYTADGLNTYFQAARIEVASNSGSFTLKTGIANGSIDYIALKNHVTNNYSDDKIEAKSGMITTGLTLNAYCISNGSNYKPNGKISGAQTPNCSLNYFPAGLMSSASTPSFNFNFTPSLVSGTALLAGAIYKYEGVTPGVDAIVKIDSLIGGATLTKIDDNSGGLGYSEGFQPEVKDGPTAGQSYAVFTISYKITGTSVSQNMNTFSLTALDIDGNSTMKEFDEIGLGAGATAAYRATPPHISLTEILPGTFRGINIDGVDQSGIDTSLLANMFTVSNSNVSSFTLKLGTVKTNTTQNSRQFGIYMKGFVYPAISSLPVELISFTAILNNEQDKTYLNWTTASEINVSHFEVERSFDGQDYKQIALVFAAGNSGSKLDYVYKDNLAGSTSTIIYYRLKMVDNDGKYTYSNVRVVRIGKQNDKSIAINTFPNPVTNELRITVPNTWQGKKANYEVIGNNGQIAIRNGVTSASQTETINVSKLSPGFYIVKVSCNGETAQQKIIKQ